MTMNAEKPLIILSAGGTGGHVFPARALAHDLLSRQYRVALMTDDRGMRFADEFTAHDIPVYTIPSGTLGKGIWGKISGLVRLGFGIAKAWRLMRQLKPAVVIGFGGYPSVPAVYAAQKRGISTIIHEQNAIIGRANALLAPKADRIALSIPQSSGLDEADIVRSVVTGNPVREDITALYTKPYPMLDTNGPFHILVFGGSLGAKIFAETVPAALASLPDMYRPRLRVVQQYRDDEHDALRAVYDKAGIAATLTRFIGDMPEQLAQAHLVIARSGASTVAEVSIAGRPAIFVPAGYHKDQQQKRNADAIADVGGAWVMTDHAFTPDVLAQRIEGFLQNPEILFRAAEASRSCARPDAARKLGNLVTAIASGWDKDDNKTYDITQGYAG